MRIAEVILNIFHDRTTTNDERKLLDFVKKSRELASKDASISRIQAMILDATNDPFQSIKAYMDDIDDLIRSVGIFDQLEFCDRITFHQRYGRDMLKPKQSCLSKSCLFLCAERNFRKAYETLMSYDAEYYSAFI